MKCSYEFDWKSYHFRRRYVAGTSGSSLGDLVRRLLQQRIIIREPCLSVAVTNLTFTFVQYSDLHNNAIEGGFYLPKNVKRMWVLIKCINITQMNSDKSYNCWSQSSTWTMSVNYASLHGKRIWTAASVNLHVIIGGMFSWKDEMVYDSIYKRYRVIMQCTRVTGLHDSLVCVLAFFFIVWLSRVYLWSTALFCKIWGAGLCRFLWAMVVALLSASLLRGFVLSLALLGGIVLRKARFVCSPLVFEGVPVSYETLESVLHQIYKHLEVVDAPRFLNLLLSVWMSDETHLLVFDILPSPPLPIHAAVLCCFLFTFR